MIGVLLNFAYTIVYVYKRVAAIGCMIYVALLGSWFGEGECALAVSVCFINKQIVKSLLDLMVFRILDPDSNSFGTIHRTKLNLPFPAGAIFCFDYDVCFNKLNFNGSMIVYSTGSKMYVTPVQTQ